jgi:pimeloyl-ACP methyl ester carboxylesterase
MSSCPSASQSAERDKPMTGLIVFIHGFRGGEEHWNYVPLIVAPAFGSFEVKSLLYSSEYNSLADITRSADQLLTRLKAEYANSDPVFLVGYSMGGLIAREICLRLLADPAEKQWLQKVRGVVTVGSPLCGLRAILHYSSEAFSGILSEKVQQVKDGEFVFGRYKKAIEAAKDRGINGPKHMHIEIENDEICASHDVKLYTSDDRRHGVIPGTHREFIPTKDHETRLANIIIEIIRSLHSALGPALAGFKSDAETKLPDRLLLISCSHAKQTGGDKAYGGPGAANWISDKSVRDKLLSNRTQVFRLLKDAGIDNGFETAENRLHENANRGIQRGPDFGGVQEANGASYLPAFQRYCGKSYTQIDSRTWDHYYAHNQDKLCVLIMSGLYGLLEASEWIQEYDIHLTDRVRETGMPLTGLWRDFFTELLINYVKGAHRNGRKVQIVNCLCDTHYVDSVRWRDLPPEASVYHLASPHYEHKTLLPLAGTLSNSLLMDPERLDKIERTTRMKNVLYPTADFGEPPETHARTQIAFEARIGDLRATD